MLNTTRKWHIGFISFLFLALIVTSITSANPDYVIDGPTGMSSIITVNDNFSVNYETHLLFSNVLNEPANVQYFMPIVEYEGPGFDFYLTSDPFLASTKNESFLVINGTLAPYSTSELIFTRFVDKSENNPGGGIYSLEYQGFTSQSFMVNKVEVRIPLMKNLDFLIEPLNHTSVSPDDTYYSDKHLVLIWDEDLHTPVYLQYTYGFDLMRLVSVNPILNSIFSALVGFTLGVLLTKSYRFLKIRYKPKKRNE